MIKIFNYFLLLSLFFLNTSLAEIVNVFEFTEKELSELKVRKVRGADEKTLYSLGENENGNFLRAEANNSASGGSMVPTIVLGIPGSGTSAIILVGLMVHGLRPGVYLFTEQVEKVYQIFGSMFVANVMFMLMGLYAAKLFARVSLVPTQILWPIVFALSVIGAYAFQGQLLDVWLALIFGVIGYFARRHGFSVAPIAVGLILGEMVETNLQHSLKMYDGAWWMILAQPLALMFLVFAFLGLCGPMIYSWITKQKD